MIFVGIDPGLDGGLCILSMGGVDLMVPMPTVGTGATTKRELDIPRLHGHLAPLVGKQCNVTIEKAQAFPGSEVVTQCEKCKHSTKTRRPQGAVATFRYGAMYGLLIGIVHGLGLSWRVVKPRRWQNDMLAGLNRRDTKQAAYLAASSLYPRVDFRATARSVKPHSGMVDALLIAEWNRKER